MRKYVLIIIPFLVSLLSVGCGQQQVSFSKEVKPVLDTHCLECHDGVGEGSKRTDFLVTDYASIMQGTKYGPVVIPGDSLSSSLYRVINHMADPEIQMPPHHKRSLAEGRSESLPGEQIMLIQKWIDQGAKNN